jgi:flavin reductase (DIM6/NTAB) family NADH-FMN oxidoreductase RutF
MSVQQVLDTRDLRDALGAFPTGVTAVAAVVNGSPVGLAANSFTSVSLDPAIVSVCVAHSSTTWPILRTANRLGVSVLGAHQEHACRQLSALGGDRFAALDWHATNDGAVLLNGTSAWLDTSIEQEIVAGDHNIVLLRVHSFGIDSQVAPLVFHASRFRTLQS